MIFDLSFFKKHQRLIVRAANSQWTRWLFGLHRLPEPLQAAFKAVDAIGPNSLHLRLPDGNIKSVFFTRPRFAEALAYNLSPFVYMQAPRPVWRFSLVGVLGMLAMLAIPKIGFLGFFGTTTAFYPAAGDGDTSNQGLTAGQTWTNCRNGTGGTLIANYTATTWNDGSFGYGAGRLKDGNGRWVLFRDHCPIYTSALSDVGTILSATLNLKPNAHASGGGDSCVVVQSTAASNTTLAGSDFNQVGFTALSNAINFADLVDGTYSVFTLNGTGLAAISKTGFSKFALISSADQTNSEPAGGTVSGTMMRSSEYSGTTSDPYLEVVTVTDSLNMLLSF